MGMLHDALCSPYEKHTHGFAVASYWRPKKKHIPVKQMVYRAALNCRHLIYFFGLGSQIRIVCISLFSEQGKRSLSNAAAGVAPAVNWGRNYTRCLPVALLLLDAE